MTEESNRKNPRLTDPKKALQKAQAYCAYQERCQQEVRDKLYEWGLWKDAVEDTIVRLIGDNFLNEERFAKAYAGGKFRIKKWGRVKIKLELKKRKISEYCIRQAMKEIDEADYRKTLKKILTEAGKKAGKSKNARYKVAQYAVSRGYENELVWEIMDDK